MKHSTQLLLLGLFVIHASYIQSMNSLTQQASTVESKAEVAIQENLTLESLLNLLSADIITTQTTLFATNAMLVASTATIESLIELFTSHVDLATTDVSYLDTQFATIETILDITSTQIAYAFSSIAVLESMLDSYTQVTTIVTTTNQIAVLSALDSIAGQVASDSQTLSSQWSTINSFLDQGNTTIGSMSQSISSIDRALSLIDAQISADIVLFNRTINSTAGSSSSVLDVITPLAVRTQSIVAEVQMDISSISSSLNTITTGLTTGQILANQASIDFQQTWTILNSLQTLSLKTAESFLSTMVTTANQIQFLTDQSGTWTAIASNNSLVLLMQSQINSLINGMNRINNLAYADTFTALNQVTLGVSSVDSLIDSLISTGTVLAVIEAYLGIPIHQSDIGTTGYTISASGNYYLAEDIIFNPPFTSTAISLNVDDVSLDLAGKFITQTNGIANVFAFNTVGGGQVNDLAISNGTIAGFTGNGIIGSYLNLQLNNLIFSNCSGTAISLASGSSSSILRNVSIIGQRGTSPLTLSGVHDIIVDSCNFLEASSTSGIIINVGSTETIVRNCKIIDMNSTGIAVSGSSQKIIFDGCTINSNNGPGISLAAGSTNCVIKNCIIKNNTTFGITCAGNQTTIISNIIANNNTGLSMTGNNCAVMFNTFMSNTSTNISSSSGLQSYLGNFAFNPTTESNNYSGFLLPKIILNASKSFPAVTPTYWENISMTR